MNAARAGAAVIGSKGWIGVESEVEKYFRKQEIRAFLRMDETGVPADPADARPLGEVALEDGTRVGVPAVLHRTPNLLLNLTVAYREQKRYAEAVSTGDMLLRASKPSPRLLWMLGQIAELAGDKKKATAIYDQGLKLLPAGSPEHQAFSARKTALNPA